ncbi:hypothetical protein [Scytonema sp. NUACC21]
MPTIRNFQIKKSPTFSCGAGWTPVNCTERAGTPVPQEGEFIS